MAVAPTLPHLLHRIRGPNDGTGTSSGHPSTLTSVWWPQALQVTNSPRTPFWRMLPRVIGSIGSSERGMVGHSNHRADVSEPIWGGDPAAQQRPSRLGRLKPISFRG
jgi:hypothetical protein